MKARTSPLIVGFGLLIAMQVHAQSLYRCGSVYQDRPCDAGKPGKVVGSSGAGEAPPASTDVDAQCVQRGKDAMKIVWSREGGATEERVLADARSPEERRLVRDVYRRPGSASTVRSAVEADCMAEKRKAEEDTAKAIAAALKAQREGTLMPERASPQPAEAGAHAAAAEARQRERAAYEADRKKQQCAQYNSQLETLRAQERTGGNARRMDELNDQRRSLRAQMSSAGC
jgi:hypothetical protein